MKLTNFFFFFVFWFVQLKYANAYKRRPELLNEPYRLGNNSTCLCISTIHSIQWHVVVRLNENSPDFVPPSREHYVEKIKHSQQYGVISTDHVRQTGSLSRIVWTFFRIIFYFFFPQFTKRAPLKMSHIAQYVLIVIQRPTLKCP